MTDPVTIRLSIARTDALTLNQRLHHQVRAKKTKHLRALAAAAVAEQASGVTFERAHLVVHIGWPDRRRRDSHNLVPTIKALIDGCVDAGLLPDDDDAHMLGPDLRPHHAGAKGLIEIEMTFSSITHA